MREWQSQSHVKWYCKYHVVFAPKYRKRAIFGQLKKSIGGVIRQLCQQEGVELVEGHAMADHVHLCLSIAVGKRGHVVESGAVGVDGSEAPGAGVVTTPVEARRRLIELRGVGGAV